jgi:sugar O-acyltransferase (sialic acid O-acetyltransferase NeuD family)
MKKIILIGAGGHAKSCLDVILLEKKFKVLGFIDKKKNINLLDYKVLGDEKYLKSIEKKSLNLHISLGFIKSPLKRIKIFNKFKKLNFKFPVIVSPKSQVSKKSIILDGTIVHHFAVINFDAKIGYNNIINTSAIIEHGVKIGNNCHISTRAVINGDVEIKDNTFIGSGAVIREGIKVGKNCFIGMGQIVTSNLKDNSFLK